MGALCIHCCFVYQYIGCIGMHKYLVCVFVFGFSRVMELHLRWQHQVMDCSFKKDILYIVPVQISSTAQTLVFWANRKAADYSILWLLTWLSKHVILLKRLNWWC